MSKNSDLAPWTAEDQAKFEEMLAARPEGEEIEQAQHFNPSVVCFRNGELLGVSRNLPVFWSWAERRIEKLLWYVARRWRVEYIHQCIERGAMMLAVIVDDNNALTGAGIIEVVDTEEEQRAVVTYLHVFDPVNLSDLSQFCEILALGVDADASAIWSTVECEALPGYESIPCIFGRLQGVRITPIQ